MALALALLAALGAATLAGCRFSVDYHRYAIVYGVADYSPAGLGANDLTYPSIDAQELAAQLEDQGFEVLPRLRLDSAANRANLEADFQQVKLAASPDDLFLFYFSGHGGPVDDAGNPLPQGVPAAAEVLYLDATTAPDPLTISQLASLLADIPARKRVVILDACNSGGFIGSHLEADRFEPDYMGNKDSLFGVLGKAVSLYANFAGSGGLIPPSLSLVMAAAGSREFSFETDGYQNGIFTYYLLQAAQRGDRNRDGWVTVSEAYGYVRDAIEAEWNRRFPPGSIEIFAPRVSGGPVDFVLFQAR